MRLFRLPRARRHLPRAPHDIRDQIRTTMGGFKHASNRRLLTSPRGPTSSLQGERAGGGRRSPWLPLPPALPAERLAGRAFSGRPGLKNGPAGRAWALGQARRPAGHGPGGPRTVPARHPPGRAWHGPVPCRAGPARWPSIVVHDVNIYELRRKISNDDEITYVARRSVGVKMYLYLIQTA